MGKECVSHSLCYQKMSLLYKSKRMGKAGKEFDMYKFRTLREGIDGVTSFVDDQTYTRFGKFLRKTKLDELPQVWNVVKGDMSIFGYRPEEKKTFDMLPEHMREMYMSVKPGIIDLSSVYFIDEEEMLSKSTDPHKAYWIGIKPIKFVLQCFYIENRCVLLNLAILWLFIKKMVKKLL